MKRKVIVLLLILIVILCVASIANAGVSSGIYGGTTCTVGDVVRLRVEYSGSGLAAGAFTVTEIINENNPNAILLFQSTSSNVASISSNYPKFTWEVSDSDLKNNGLSNVVFYLDFKTTSVGTCEVKLDTLDLSDCNGSSLSGGSDSVSVTVNNPAKSGNNSLSSITPSKGELVPAFSSDILDYTLTVEYSDEEVVFGYKTSDSGASASINGSNALGVGSNERTITVTAANGSTKKYKINIIRADEDGTLPDGTNLYEIRKLNALSININDVIYRLVDDISGYKIPSGFINEVIKYNEYDIPVLTLKKTKVKMAYALPVGETIDDSYESEEVTLEDDTYENVPTTEPEETEDSSFKGGIWVFYDEEVGAFLPSYPLKGEETIDLTHYLLFGDEEEPIEEPSIFDDNLLIFIVLATVLLLFIVIVCLQISIIKGRKKNKTKENLEEETSTDNIDNEERDKEENVSENTSEEGTEGKKN